MGFLESNKVQKTSRESAAGDHEAREMETPLRPPGADCAPGLSLLSSALPASSPELASSKEQGTVWGRLSNGPSAAPTRATPPPVGTEAQDPGWMGRAAAVPTAQGTEAPGKSPTGGYGDTRRSACTCRFGPGA